VSAKKGNISTTKLSNMNFFCNLIIVIPRLPCLFNMGNAVSSTVVLVNSETSHSVSSFNFAMCAFAASVSPWSWAHALMDAEKLDDKQYI